MNLYKLEASNWDTFFGTPADKLNIDQFITRNTIRIAQTPSCDAFLLLSKDTFEELELLDSVPAGFDFTYCQAWGLTVDDDVVDRVILDLRKKAYPIWQDQLDDIYHNGIDAWKATIKATKDKYPKR
jgi:hypothetical protein|tara:strand:- start:275 stop:655 length:381 start_codon:yes stop_codon:yes gene_type:complete